jgi:hypothetical protein
MVKQIAIALDQLLNALCGGWADETLSARVYRNRNNSSWWRFWYRALNALFFWQPDHCLGAFFSETHRKQLPKIYRRTSNNGPQFDR